MDNDNWSAGNVTLMTNTPNATPINLSAKWEHLPPDQPTGYRRC
jgi:hypothetical protein